MQKKLKSMIIRDEIPSPQLFYTFWLSENKFIQFWNIARLRHLQSVSKRRIEGILLDRIRVIEIQFLELHIGLVYCCHHQVLLPSIFSRFLEWSPRGNWILQSWTFVLPYFDQKRKSFKFSFVRKIGIYQMFENIPDWILKWFCKVIFRNFFVHPKSKMMYCPGVSFCPNQTFLSIISQDLAPSSTHLAE